MALYMAGLGLYSQSQAFIDRSAGVWRSASTNWWIALRPVWTISKTSVYRTVIPRRFQEGGGEIPPPPEPRRRTREKEEIRPAEAASDSGSPRPAGTDALGQLHLRLPAVLLRCAADGVLRAVSGVLHSELARSFALAPARHLEGEARATVAKTLDGVAQMVRAYVIGNFLLGLLLSLASGMLFASVRLPYWLLVAPMSGFLSLVPYIGLPLALIPPLIAALPAAPQPAMYLFLSASVALLHLLAMNLLYPKFVGSRVHLNPLVVTIALMFWGMLWGGIGLLLAIPLTAALKAVCDNVGSLKHYGRLLGD